MLLRQVCSIVCVCMRLRCSFLSCDLGCAFFGFDLLCALLLNCLGCGVLVFSVFFSSLCYVVLLWIAVVLSRLWFHRHFCAVVSTVVF